MSTSVRPRTCSETLVLAGACVLWATPVLAADGTGIGSGRLIPSVAAVTGLIGVVLGARALARSRSRIDAVSWPRQAIAGGVAGLISLSVGGLHAANAAGGVGTGNGLAGAVVAMMMG